MFWGFSTNSNIVILLLPAMFYKILKYLEQIPWKASTLPILNFICFLTFFLDLFILYLKFTERNSFVSVENFDKKNSSDLKNLCLICQHTSRIYSLEFFRHFSISKLMRNWKWSHKKRRSKQAKSCNCCCNIIQLLWGNWIWLIGIIVFERSNET